MGGKGRERERKRGGGGKEGEGGGEGRKEEGRSIVGFSTICSGYHLCVVCQERTLSFKFSFL